MRLSINILKKKTQHHRVTVWQCSYIKIADLLVVFFKNWQADVVTWEIRVTSKDILPKKKFTKRFFAVNIVTAVTELERYTVQWNLKSAIDFFRTERSSSIKGFGWPFNS